MYFYVKFRHQNPGERAKAIGEQYAPIEEPLRKVIKAYSILAYPHIQDEYYREQIETELDRIGFSFFRLPIPPCCGGADERRGV